MTDRKEYYSAEEVAELLGLHVRTVRRFIREGKLRARRIGKQYRIAEGDLRALVGSEGPVRSANRSRRVLVSTTVDIDAIGKEEQARLVTPLMGVFHSLRDEQGSKRLDAIYYEEQGRLRVVIQADIGLTNAVLGMIGAVLDDGQTDK